MTRVTSTLVMLAAALWVASPAPAAAFEREASRVDDAPLDGTLMEDCSLAAFNTCCGWIWLFDDVEGAEWGVVLDPDDCPGGCPTGGAPTGIILYARCSTVPAEIGGVRIDRVDPVGCRTVTLWQSGPLTLTHCVSGDRWTRIDMPITHIGTPFAISVIWGGQSGGTSNPRFATDNGIGNLYCRLNPELYGIFPGCATSDADCSWWNPPPQRTFIYVTDINGDGTLDDFCAYYGAPYPLSFPYLYPYGYLPNNLMLVAELDCWSPTAVEPTSWGRVKALFD